MINGWPLVVGLILAVLFLAGILALLFLELPNPNQITGGGSNDALTLTAQLPSDLEFDDNEDLEMIGFDLPVATVDSMSPTSGAVGTVSDIAGANLASAGYFDVKIGDASLILYRLTDEAVEHSARECLRTPISNLLSVI